MSNMSHCRWRNTREDLQDCYEHIDDKIDDQDESFARRKIIELCVDIADDYRDEVEDDD